MKLSVQEELRPLVLNRSQPCISIYMPTLRGKENQQNAIRFKNLTGKARDYLVARGMKSREAQEYVEPLEAMMLDDSRWRNCSDGLAVFRSQDMLQDFRLPRSFHETVVVSDRFHLTPILPMLARERFFYLLALNLSGVRMFHCTKEAMSELEIVAKMPRSLEELLSIYELSESPQVHTVSGVAGARPTGIMHGHGSAGTDDAVRKTYILEYFRQVDRGLRQQVLDQTRAPVLLAGVKYLCSLYREAASHRQLLDIEVGGSSELMSLKELHREAWAAYEPYQSQAKEAAVGRYREQAGTSLASSELQRIVPAAYRGQVNLLLVPVGLQRWGTFNTESGEIQIHPRQQNGEEDLVDLAAVHTLMHGGEVFMIEEDTPCSSLAAIFRYE